MGRAVAAVPIIGPMLGGLMDVFGVGPASEAEKAQNRAMEKQKENMQESMRLQKELDEQMAQSNYARQGQWQETQEQNWKENAFMTPAEVATKRAAGLSLLSNERTNAYDRLARNLSVRGIGPGSAYASKPAAGIESGYMTGRGNLENTLLTAQNTPRFAYPFVSAPGAATGVSMGSTGYAPINNLYGETNPFGMALGIAAGNKYFDSFFNSGGGTYENAMAGAGGISANDPFNVAVPELSADIMSLIYA